MTMSSRARPIAFDVTHLVSRLNRHAMTGIDRVDIIYARYLVENQLIDCGVHYGLRNPHIHSCNRVRRLTAEFVSKIRESDEEPLCQEWGSLRAWLTGEAAVATAKFGIVNAHRRKHEGWQAFLRQSILRVVHDPGQRVPDRAIYLNVAQSAFEFHRFFHWLQRRPDVAPVFLVHDLLPLDCPEFFRHGYQERFKLRVDTIVRHARALITTTATVRDRLIEEYGMRKVIAPPIHVQPLPSPLGGARGPDDADVTLSRIPYFVMIATIEPRKNHQTILHAWRSLPSSVRPKLVLVGVSGWSNEQILSLLDHSPALADCVRHVSGLPRRAMRQLIANSRAVLLPSFAEGFGLPVVEALSLGTPAIISDISVFREVSQGAAHFVSPIDGLGWAGIISEFARENSSKRIEAIRNARTFLVTNEQSYFYGILEFLNSI